MWSLGWPHVQDRGELKPITVRALFANWLVKTYPVNGLDLTCCENSNSLVSSTHLFLRAKKIDALILEFRVDEQSIALVGTYLWPPFNSELQLVKDFVGLSKQVDR